MQRKYFYLEHEKALLHYSEYGKGAKVLISFHGFGQTKSHFVQLENVLGDEYKIFSFDLFYHGESFWHERDKPLSKLFWRKLMEKFLKENSIENFSLMGFSMGGKFALATLEQFPKAVNEVILIAPDGIKTSFWYNFATYPTVIRKFFRNIIMKPVLYHRIVNLLSFFRIMDKGILRFANTQMETREQRRRVYYSWVVFKDLKFNLDLIGEILVKNNIKLDLFLGEFDKVITRKNMESLIKKIKLYHIYELKAGHSNLIDAVAQFYASEKDKHE